MWSTIVSSIFSIFEKWFGAKIKKDEIRQEEVKAAQTEEKVKKAERIRDVEIKDEKEKLVSDAQKAKTEEEKKRILDRIRIEVGG